MNAIDDYLAGQPEPQRTTLAALRSTIAALKSTPTTLAPRS